MADRWEIVRTVGTDEEAGLIQGFLESRGVAVEIESLLFHQEPVTFGRLGEVRVRVPVEQGEEARRLLAALEAGEAEEASGGEAFPAESDPPGWAD